ISNCGACNLHCSYDHATTACVQSLCALVGCDPGYKNCNGVIGDGCEANLQSDAANCGGCAMPCKLGPNVTSVICTLGKCVINGCAGSFADCNGNPGDGCETDTSTDVANCGQCGKACFATVCVAGKCVMMKRAFLTSQTTQGTAFGSTAGADSICTTI